MTTTTTESKLTVKQFLEKYGHYALTVRKNELIIQAAKRFSDTVYGKKYSVAVVLDDDKTVCGILSLGDIVHAVHTKGTQMFGLFVSDIMTSNVKTAGINDRIISLLEKMKELELRHIPIVDDNKLLLGLVTRKDALEGLYDDASLELQHMTEFVFRSGARY